MTAADSGSKASVEGSVTQHLLQAELWGIRCAMKLASERSWLEAMVEANGS